MAPLNPHMASAMCLFFELTDAKIGQWRSQTEWEAQVEVLMKSKRFGKILSGAGPDKVPAPLKSWPDWKKHISSTLSANRRAPGDKFKHIPEKGSDALMAAYLQKIGYPSHLRDVLKKKAAVAKAAATRAAKSAARAGVSQPIEAESEASHSEVQAETLKDETSEEHAAEEQSVDGQTNGALQAQEGQGAIVDHALDVTQMETQGPASVRSEPAEASSTPVSTPARDFSATRQLTSPLRRNLGLTQMSNKEIKKALDNILGDVESCVVNMLECQGVNTQDRATWVAWPTPQLADLYAALLGGEWHRNSIDLQLTGKMSSEDLLVGCMSAAVYDWVLARPVPWISPTQILKELQRWDILEGHDNFMVNAGDGLSAERAIWEAGRYRVLHDLGFKERTMIPLADQLAKRFLTAITPQLLELGVGAMSARDATSFSAEQNAEIHDIFYSALKLKGLIEVDPHDFSFGWVPGSVELQRECMKERHASIGRQEVLWCISPMAIRLGVDGGQDKVISPATVYTRRWG